MNLFKPRILHCLHSVGGQSATLAREERELGAISLSVSMQESKFGYHSDEILWHENTNLISQELARWRLLFRAIREFDVIHYNYGSSMLNWGALDGRHCRIMGGLGGLYALFNQSIELPLVKKMGLVIAVTYQGDDARQGDFSKANFSTSIANDVDEKYYSKKTDETKRQRISKFAKYADLIYAVNPDLLHVLPKRARFLPYAHISIDAWKPSEYFESNRRPLVIHAPSNRDVKGTKYILEAVSELKRDGIDFDFKLIENLSHAEAKSLYEKADLLVDQLLAGWYGGLSVELMALGKPVICYLRRSDFRFIPQSMANEMPLIDASPDSIKDVLKEWILKTPNERRNRGVMGRSYVEKWHNPKSVAMQLLRDYEEVIISRNG